MAAHDHSHGAWIACERLVLSTCRQAGGAPIVDRGRTRLADGREGPVLTVLPPWRWLARKPERPESVALVLGWLP